MVNDESSQPASPVDTSRLPVTIKRVERRSREKKNPKRKLSNSHSDSAKKNVTMIKSNNKNEVVILPSGISVEVIIKINFINLYAKFIYIFLEKRTVCFPFRYIQV